MSEEHDFKWPSIMVVGIALAVAVTTIFGPTEQSRSPADATKPAQSPLSETPMEQGLEADADDIGKRGTGERVFAPPVLELAEGEGVSLPERMGDAEETRQHYPPSPLLQPRTVTEGGEVWMESPDA